MKKKIFIDGSAGTTGLRIAQRLAQRDDLEMLTIPEEKRKDIQTKKAIINSADVVFLCLPDLAAVESVALVENPNTVVIDASTAHRTLAGWAYGFPELDESFDSKVQTSKRIAVPGCHASGFIALVYPLIKAGILDKNALITCHSLTGYSGGGKAMIAEYESQDKNALLGAPRHYAIAQQHKHLKEMKAITGLDIAPVFSPIVCDFYSGMLVTVPLFASQINGTIDDIKAVYAKTYQGEIVQYKENLDENGFISALALSGKDSMYITVTGNGDRMVLTALYDNLGKGASGAGVECMNIAIGADRKKGLVL